MNKINSVILQKYLCMINDNPRNKFYKDALTAHAKDKVVIDVGTGTGILSAYALAAGAKFVYAIELHPESAKMADFALSKCFDRSRFQVIHANFWSDDVKSKIPENSVDIVVSELIGPGLHDQGQCITWYCAKPFLKDTAISIPDRVHCDAHVWSEKIDLSTKFYDRLKFDYMDPSAIMLDQFADALLEYSQVLDQRDYQPVTHHWANINFVTQSPDIVYTDVSDITLNSMPEFIFSDNPRTFPNHIKPDIRFTLDLTQPGVKTVAIINKISFENTTLVCPEAPCGPWRWSPTMYVNEPGRYEFVFTDIKYMPEKQWIVTKL